MIEKFIKMPWQPWLKRRFPVLVAYLMIKNASKEAFAKQDVKGEMSIVLFERSMWYSTEEAFKKGGDEAEKYIKKHGMNFFVDICYNGYKNALLVVEETLQDKKTPPLEQYQKIIQALDPVNLSIWTAHAGEVYFNNELEKRLGNRVDSKDLERYIGDLGFPKRKNSHALMVDDVLNSVAIEELHYKYSWLKSRVEAGFDKGYSMDEMKELRDNILKNPPEEHEYPDMPEGLEDFIAEFQELVYLRTLRTDSLFEIYFRAQPIFKRLEKELGIDSVKYYLPEGLIGGRLVRYDKEFAILKYYEDVLVTKDKIVSDDKVDDKEVKGSIAWKGKVKGKVRKIMQTSEVGKLKEGEILVTNMTIPAYLLAMKKASAFVTDEGGITCHAAIIAREMRKPCIIGTKIATQVFKDGDMVEVDADNGVVRKI